MPFGFEKTAQTFHRLIDKILCGLLFVYTYINVILIVVTDNAQHLKQEFQRLSHFCLKINLNRYISVATKIIFIEPNIDAKEISSLTLQN